jgi:hypothetical protein
MLDLDTYNDGDIFRNNRDGEGEITVDKERKEFVKEERVAKNYHPGLFEWTHFRA